MIAIAAKFESEMPVCDETPSSRKRVRLSLKRARAPATSDSVSVASAPRLESTTATPRPFQREPDPLSRAGSLVADGHLAFELGRNRYHRRRLRASARLREREPHHLRAVGKRGASYGSADPYRARASRARRNRAFARDADGGSRASPARADDS